MTSFIAAILILALWAAICWFLFVKVWPERRKRVEQPFSWPNSVFERKDK